MIIKSPWIHPPWDLPLALIRTQGCCVYLLDLKAGSCYADHKLSLNEEFVLCYGIDSLKNQPSQSSIKKEHEISKALHPISPHTMTPCAGRINIGSLIRGYFRGKAPQCALQKVIRSVHHPRKIKLWALDRADPIGIEYSIPGPNHPSADPQIEE